MDTLLPWILQLHVNREQGIRKFQNLNKIGRPMMCEDPFDINYAEMIKIIDNSAKISAMFVS
jgi:hypothetical protein